MAKLTGQTIADSYDQLLIVTGASGITSSLQAVESGDTDGAVASLQISTVAAAIDNPTASSATQGGKLTLFSDDGAALGDTHRLGVIEFSAAEDTSSTITIGARIEAIADAAWSASENGADMVFYTTDGNASQSEVLRLTADNKVGIGIAGPDGTCHVHTGTSGSITADITDLVVETGSSGGISILTPADEQGEIAFGNPTDANICRIAYNHGGNYLATVVNTAEVMRIISAGEVGIGVTPATDVKLHIAGKASSTQVPLLKLVGDSTNTEGIEITTTGSGNGFSALDISTGGNANAFRVTNAGRVGIGDVSPVTALDIHSAGTEVVAGFGMADDGNAYISVRTAETQNNVAGIVFTVGSSAVDGFSSSNGLAYIASTVNNDGGSLQGDLGFYTNAGDSLGSAKVKIYNGGEIDMSFHGDTSSSGTAVFINSSGRMGTTTSLREYKGNIKKIDIDATALMNKFEPVTFNYKKYDTTTGKYLDELENGFEAGMIVDDVQDFASDFNQTDKDGKVIGIRYHLLVPYLIKAVQELSAKVEALEDAQ